MWALSAPCQGVAAIPPFVWETWLSSFRKSPWAGVVPNNLYKPVYLETMRQLVERGAEVVCATNPEKPGHILGWLCYERTSDAIPVVHYCFVKPLFRKRGVAASLFAAAGIDPKQRFFYTFKTPAARYFPGGQYEPAIARRQKA